MARPVTSLEGFFSSQVCRPISKVMISVGSEFEDLLRDFKGLGRFMRLRITFLWNFVPVCTILTPMKAPYFLVAMPQLEDDNFSKTVLLIREHSESGAFGWILNGPLQDDDQQQAKMTAELKDASGQTLLAYQEPLYFGGPVDEDSVFGLHSIASLGKPESVVTENLWLCADPEMFQEILEDPDNAKKRRFFLGCASWEPKQLDIEIRQGLWLLVPYSADFVFDDPAHADNFAAWSEGLWKRVIRSVGLEPLTLISTMPSTDTGDSKPN